MDRYWLLTWTTYGTWLPGDQRGFVSNVPNGSGPEVRHNIPGTPYDADDEGACDSVPWTIWSANRSGSPSSRPSSLSSSSGRRLPTEAGCCARSRSWPTTFILWWGSLGS